MDHVSFERTQEGYPKITSLDACLTHFGEILYTVTDLLHATLPHYDIHTKQFSADHVGEVMQALHTKGSVEQDPRNVIDSMLQEFGSKLCGLATTYGRLFAEHDSNRGRFQLSEQVAEALRAEVLLAMDHALAQREEHSASVTDTDAVEKRRLLVGRMWLGVLSYWDLPYYTQQAYCDHMATYCTERGIPVPSAYTLPPTRSIEKAWWEETN